MKRLIGYVIAVALLVGVLLLPALFWNFAAGDDPTEPTTITNYNATFTVSADGGLDVVEKLTVDFPLLPDRHGIFRFWDRVDSSLEDEARRKVEDVKVTLDGKPVQFEMSVKDNRYDVAKIGDPNSYVDFGSHVYEIRYHFDDVLTPGETSGTKSQFYWQLIPGGWQQEIDKAVLTVNLPTPAENVQCAVDYGKTNNCTISGDGTQTIKVTAENLDPKTPVSLLAGQSATPNEPPGVLPWAPRFDNVLGHDPTGLGLVVLGGLGAAGIGAGLARQSFERKPQFPLMYAPPDGIGPAQAKYVFTESIDREAYVATLMHAAERGAISLDKSEDAWTITDKGGPQGWAKLDQVSLGVAHLLSGPGTSFVAAKDSVSAGERLKTEVATFEGSVKEWAQSAGFMTKAGLGGFGGFLVLGGICLVIANVIFNPFHLAALGLIPGLFALAGLGMLKTGASTKRTATGRELWSRIGGFHRVLSTPSSVDRFDFSGRQELYTAYIPWAVALGCADQWADKFRTEMGQEPPSPAYLGGGYYAGSYGSDFTSMVDDFDSTLDSAISSYQATQSSSSSGGGGFSGGGGGGGGGGGSW